MKKQIIYGFLVVVLLLLVIFIVVLYFKTEMKARSKDTATFFWVIDKNKLSDILDIWPTLTEQKIIQMSEEMLDALTSYRDMNSHPSDHFFVYQRGFQDAITPEKTDSIIGNQIAFLKSMINKLQDHEEIDVVIPDIITLYQTYVGGGMFQEAWYVSPYIYFSESFYSDYLPNNNIFIRDNNFYLRGDTFFERFPQENRLLRDSVENLGFFMTYVPTDYAKKVIENRGGTLGLGNDFKNEADVFYELMQKVAREEVYAFVFEIE